MPGLTPAERRELEESGFLVVADALSPEQSMRLVAAMDELTAGRPGEACNVADILATHSEFLDLVDLPAVLPRVRDLLSSNIWLNHSHLNVSPPTDEIDGPPAAGYGWHRDGGAINHDLPHPAPLLSVKVGLYLTDLSEAGRGQTYVLPGSHRTGQEPPGPQELPAAAQPLLVRPGTAVLFDRRVIHSLRSPNRSPLTRRAIFVQYAFRWICAVDAMSVESLRPRCDPVRLQLLGLNADSREVGGATGRSVRFYPREGDVPLARPGSGWRARLDSLKRRVSRRLRR